MMRIVPLQGAMANDGHQTHHRPPKLAGDASILYVKEMHGASEDTSDQ
tara:strand:- start:707 stop:850 length:144 start_codon:yes stop_codon:yes gene_type:complete